jgi:hypothetical protein
VAAAAPSLFPSATPCLSCQHTQTYLLVDVADVYCAPDIVLEPALHLLAAAAALHLLLLLAAGGPHASSPGASRPSWPTPWSHPAPWYTRWAPSAIHHTAHGWGAAHVSPSLLWPSGALLVLLLRPQGRPAQPWCAAWVPVACRRAVACRRHALLLLVVEAGLLHHLLLSWGAQHHVVHALGQRKGVCLLIAIRGPGHVLVRGQVVLRWLGDGAIGQDAVGCGMGDATTIPGLLGRILSELGPSHVLRRSATLLLLLLSHSPADAAGSRLPPPPRTESQRCRCVAMDGVCGTQLCVLQAVLLLSPQRHRLFSCLCSASAVARPHTYSRCPPDYCETETALGWAQQRANGINRSSAAVAVHRPVPRLRCRFENVERAAGMHLAAGTECILHQALNHNSPWVLCGQGF